MSDIIFDPQMTSYDMASLEALVEQKRPHCAVEIGSWKGLSSSIIARYSDLLYCVDTWQGAMNEEHMVAEASLRSVLEIFRSNMKNLNLTEKVKPMVMTSAQAQKIFIPGIIDFIYIDGDHSYEAVMEDFNWFEKLMPGAIMAGHDNDSAHPGVQRALKESFGDSFKAMDKSSVWFIQKAL